MRRIFKIFALLLSLFLILPMSAKESTSTERVRLFAENNIQWMGNAALRIIGTSNTIYFDPLSNVKEAKADIILITHSHADHLSFDALYKLTSSNMIIIAPEPYIESVTTLKPGEMRDINGITIEAVPAYTLVSSVHPRDKQWVGYIVTVDGIRIYVSGDTDRIPEMKAIKADIAILSIPGNRNAMDFAEGALASQDIMPKIAIPVHYVGVITDLRAGKIFKEMLEGKVEVVMKPTKFF